MYAARDAFGVKDVWEDIKYTFRARGVSYKAYEAADGGLHHGAGRQRRIRAGLRYSKGGKAKYWLNDPNLEGERQSLLPKTNGDHHEQPFRADDSSDSDMSDAPSLDFEDVSDGEEAMYERARRVGYAGFPNIDISREQARRVRRHEEDGILAGRRLRLSSDANKRPDSPAGSAPERQRRSAKNRQADKDKGKGKSRAGVYGQWGEHTSSRPAPVIAEVDDAPFDGENENPGAWHANGDGVSLRWTQKPRLVVETEPQPQPKPDEVPEAASPETVVERSDAVDLVSESQIEVPETRNRSFSATLPPPEAKPVKLIPSPHEEEPSQSISTTLAPPKNVPPRHTASAPPAVERDPSPSPSPRPSSPPRSLEADISPPDIWERPVPVATAPAPARVPSPKRKAMPKRVVLPKHASAVPVAPAARVNAPPPPESSSSTSKSFRVPSYSRWEPDENPWA